MKKTIHQAALVVTVLAFIFSFPQFAFAVGSSGVENASYSARSLGQGNAVVARPEGPDSILFNPASLPDLPGVQIQSNLEGLAVHTRVKLAGTGDIERSDSPLVLIPTGVMSWNLGETFDNRVGMGFGYTIPFGTKNQYESHSVIGRYQGHKNFLAVGAYTMALGVKVNEKLNIGGSAILYHVQNYDQFFNYPNNFVLKDATQPDGIAETKLRGFGWGWTTGVLFKPVEKHKIGVYYRSKSSIDVHGMVRVTGLVAGDLQGFKTTPFFETTGYTGVQIPPNITIGYAYVPSDKWAVEIDGGWTAWSVFADQDFAFDDGNAVLKSLGTIPRDYDNTLSLNLGGHYRLNPKFDLLAGLFFYQAGSPIEHVDAVIPDSHRFAGSLGLTYNITKRLDFSTTYFGMFFQPRSVGNPEAALRSGLNIDGKYSSFAHGFMTGVTYRFGDQTDGVLKPSNGHVEPL